MAAVGCWELWGQSRGPHSGPGPLQGGTRPAILGWVQVALPCAVTSSGFPGRGSLPEVKVMIFHRREWRGTALRGHLVHGRGYSAKAQGQPWDRDSNSDDEDDSATTAQGSGPQPCQATGSCLTRGPTLSLSCAPQCQPCRKAGRVRCRSKDASLQASAPRGQGHGASPGPLSAPSRGQLESSLSKLNSET